MPAAASTGYRHFTGAAYAPLNTWFRYRPCQNNKMTLAPSPTQKQLFLRAAAHLDVRPAGPTFATGSAVLGQVQLAQSPGTKEFLDAFLKVTWEPEEAAGLRAQAAWTSVAMAPVLANTTLRLSPTGSARPVAPGADPLEQSAQVVAAVMPLAHIGALPTDLDLAGAVRLLHTDLAGIGWLGLTPLESWFATLTKLPTPPEQLPSWARATVIHGRTVARALMANQQDVTALHGDVHHRNLLDFSGAYKPGPDWKFIDPKALYGDRAFDYVNIMFNPDLPRFPAADRVLGRAQKIADAADLNLDTYLRWVGAYGCLSALWHLESEGEQDSHPSSGPFSRTNNPAVAEAVSKLGIVKLVFDHVLPN